MTPDAERVLRLLAHERGGPPEFFSVKQADMAFVLGLSTRAVQSALQELRLAGHPIISTSDGVRLTDWAIDVENCAVALRRRAITQLLTSRALRNTARRMREAEDSRSSQTFWDFFEGGARVTRADAPSPLRAEGAPSEGARLG
jgi:hypothetical protein